MSHSRRKKLRNRKRRIAYRLRDRNWAPQEDPMLAACFTDYRDPDLIEPTVE